MTEKEAMAREIEALSNIAVVAARIKAANPSLSNHQSQARALAEHPELYTEYVRANKLVRMFQGAR